MTEFHGASVVLFRADGRVLLIHEDDEARRWGLPGGMIETGETPDEAARREALEETGLDVEIGRQIVHLEEDYGDHLHHILVFGGSSWEGRSLRTTARSRRRGGSTRTRCPVRRPPTNRRSPTRSPAGSASIEVFHRNPAKHTVHR